MQQTRERTSQSSGRGNVEVNLFAKTPSSINAICLSGQWRNISEAELVQFALGESHSPISPVRLYPALRYREGTRLVTTPLSSIQGYEFSETE